MIKIGTRKINNKTLLSLETQDGGNYLKTIESDYHMCTLCGDDSHILVHHVDENRKNNNPSNLVTLCKKCHAIAHRYTHTEPNERDLKILRMWGDGGYSLHTIAKEVGLSGERVRQLYHRFEYLKKTDG